MGASKTEGDKSRQQLEKSFCKLNEQNLLALLVYAIQKKERKKHRHPPPAK